MFPDMTCDDIFRLETEHLWLRWLRAADATAIAGFASLAPIAQMTASIPHPYPAGEADRFILGVTLKNKARGLVGLVSAQAGEPGEAEIGYVMAPTHAGHGFATEATKALVDAVFRLTEARRLIANSRTINPASRRVLEKCGFAFTDTGLKTLPARGGRHPCDFFSLDRHAWALAGHVRRLPAMAEQAKRHVQRAVSVADQ